MARRARQIIEYRVYELQLDFPVLLLDGDKWHISSVKSNRLHFHNCLEIGICHSGEGTLHVKEEPVSFHGGDITCIPRHIPHTTYSAPHTASLWSYIFVELRDLLSDLIRTPEDFELTSFSEQSFVYLYPKEEYPKVHFLVLSILEELRSEKANQRMTVKALLIVLYYELQRILSAKAHESSVQPTPRKDTLVLAPALNYINTHYMQKLTVDKLAEMCHLSTTHFRRLFGSIMGTSPLNFINTTRIDRASILLQTTQAAVIDISETVGFSSVSSFNRYFSRIVGVSPRAYRNPENRTDMTPRQKSILQYRGWSEPDL